MMIGLGSVEIALAWWLSIVCAVGCVAYGLWKWNAAGKPDAYTPGDDAE